jgi:hypothetical protein
MVQNLTAAVAKVNGEVRERMQSGESYLSAAGRVRDIVARCIADEALSGREHYAPWLLEYRAAEQMVTRCMAAWNQERAATAAALALAEDCPQRASYVPGPFITSDIDSGDR